MLAYGTAGGAWGDVAQSFPTSNRVNSFVPSDPDGAAASLESSESVWGFNRAGSQVRSQGPAPATNAFILVNPAGTDFRRTQNFELHSVRVGLNYRF